MYLDHLVSGCFETPQKRYLKTNLNQLMTGLAINLDVKQAMKNEPETQALVYQATSHQLVPFLVFNFYWIQTHVEFNSDVLYGGLIDCQHSDLGIKTFYYCFDKIVNLIVNFFDHMQDYVLDLIFSYCLGAYYLLGNEAAVSQLNSQVQPFGKLLVQTDWIQTVVQNHQLFLDKEEKLAFVADLINHLPLRIKKPHYLKMVRKQMKVK